MKGSQSKKKSDLTIVTEPAEFFKDLVGKALENQKVEADQHVEFYLVNLLSQFMRSDKLFQIDELSGEAKPELLAKNLQDGLLGEGTGHRQKALKRLGDVSLYTAGFFSESLTRKVIDVEYYIDMGKCAYSNLSNIIPDEDFSRLFGELSDRFTKFVDVLSEISEVTNATQKDPQNVLRMYDLWLRTSSEKAERQLKEVGIIPPTVINKKKH